MMKMVNVFGLWAEPRGRDISYVTVFMVQVFLFRNYRREKKKGRKFLATKLGKPSLRVDNNRIVITTRKLMGKQRER